MKVSVIVPAYNEEKYLKICLKHICNQEVPADEIIVVDNNSTDNTVKIAKQFPIKIVSETTQGMIPARNRGFNEAKGDIIARVDADVAVPPDWIKKIKTMYSNHDIDAFSGPLKYDLPLQTIDSTLQFISIMKKILGHNILVGPNMILKRSAWEAVKNEVCLDDKVVHEDIDLSIHLNKHHKVIAVDPTLIVESSSRRMRQKPWSFFLEYPYRVVTTIRHHAR